MTHQGRYRAFVSYSHDDARVAAWLHRSLENYRVPKRLRGTAGEFGPIPDRLHPIFRDREELASSGDLGARVRDALAASNALILVCSPQAAQSRWVNDEVLAFQRQSNGARVYCLIVSGEPNSGDDRECFPPALRLDTTTRDRSESGKVEPIAADLRPGKDGKALAKLKLVAGLLGIGLDDLRRREAQRRHRRMFAIAVASMSGMALALILATTAWIERNNARRQQARAELASADAHRRQAQAEGLLGFLLDDLRPKLEKVGRLDLLDTVDKKASSYFSHLDSSELNDATLARQAQTLTDIGQVRLSQGRYADALASFRSAYARSNALTDRHPNDGKYLFDRGQAEYWVGFVYYQSRDLANAQIWWTRYRNTCRTVYAVDPNNVDWEHELAYGNHNLAALELDRGDLKQAAEGFELSRERLESVLKKTPGSDDLVFEIADEISWQGNVQEQLGHLSTAQALFAAKSDSLGQIGAKHPDSPQWQAEWSSADLMQSRLSRVLGKYGQAEILADAAVERMKPLIRHDPENKAWSEGYLHALVMRAAARVGAGKRAAARADLALAAPLLAGLAVEERANRHVQRDRLDAFSLQVILALHDRGADTRALLAMAPHMPKEGKAGLHSAEEVGRFAMSQLLAGMVARRLGEDAQAKAFFTTAHDLLEPLAGKSSYWRVLDPWIRLSFLNGNPRDAEIIKARLSSYGYMPLFPWPGSNQSIVEARPARTAQANNHRRIRASGSRMHKPLSRPPAKAPDETGATSAGNHRASSRGTNQQEE